MAPAGAPGAGWGFWVWGGDFFMGDWGCVCIFVYFRGEMGRGGMGGKGVGDLRDGAQGPRAHGHGARAVRKAIEPALGSFGTTVIGTPTRLESEFGGMLRDLYHPDGMPRFTNYGLEATLLAKRLAKWLTGSMMVAK